MSVYCGGGGGQSECVLWGRGRSEGVHTVGGVLTGHFAH